MKRAALIYNPRAGQLNIEPKIKPVVEFWQKEGWRIDVQASQAPGHATELARRAAEDGVSLVLAAGGDGTVSQVANGLAGSEAILAPLPVGTANALARELRLPRPQMLDPKVPLQASKYLLAGNVHQIDLTHVQSRKESGLSLLWTGIGADGFLVQQMEPRPTWSKLLGPIGFSIQALSVVHKLPAMYAAIKVDDQTHEGDFLLIVISNSRLYAGGLVELNSDGLLDDGQFEVWLFRAGEISAKLMTPRAGLMARYLTEVHLNLQEGDPGVISLRGKEVILETQPKMPCHNDGEWAGYTPLTCHIRPLALRLLVPSTASPSLFSLPGIPLVELV
jgi:diacylglycerol kinase (ATP)